MGLDILRSNLRRTAPAEPLLESPENSEPESEMLAAEWLPLCPLIMTEGISIDSESRRAFSYLGVESQTPTRSASVTLSMVGKSVRGGKKALCCDAESVVCR